MDLDALVDIGHSSTLDELQARLVRFANNLDFATISASLVTDQPNGHARFDSIGNLPAGYEEIFKDEASSKRDPVLARLKRAPVPVIWDQSTYVEAGAGDLFEEQVPWGFRTGISLVMHLPGARHLILGVDREDALPAKPEVLGRIVADVHLAMVYAQDAAVRLIAAPQHRPVQLTEREKAVLRWTLEGRSNWVIGQYMNKSENTVRYYVKCALAKLDCASKHAAAIKASRLGLLE